MPFIPNFHLQLPNFTLCPDISLSPNLAPASQSSRLPLPGGEGSPNSVPVGFHLDIYPQPLLFRPGGEFIVGSRANIPPPASSSSTRGRCWVSSCVCQWNTEAGYEGMGHYGSGLLGSKQFRKDKYDQVQAVFRDEVGLVREALSWTSCHLLLAEARAWAGRGGQSR